MEKLNDTIILRVSKADRERIRAKNGRAGRNEYECLHP